MSAYPGLFYPGQVYPGQIGASGPAQFEPPTIRRRMDTRDRLFSRMSLDEGLTVLKSPLGSYTTVTNPTPEQIDAAEICYLGGHVYEVDADEAESLTAAGYTVTYP